MDDKIEICLPVKRINRMGDYNFALIPGHPNANANNYVLYHILVMENYLGRFLTKNEVVHHKDENKNNNNISNLELMSARDHVINHNKEKIKLMIELKCPICGKIFDKRKGNTHLCKAKNSSIHATCCSKKCSSKLLSYYNRNKIPEDVQNAIDENVQSIYYTHVDPSLDEIKF